MDKERLERRLSEAIKRGEISEQEARQIFREAEEEEEGSGLAVIDRHCPSPNRSTEGE